MKVTKKYNQHRRDCWCDLKCESCGHTETYEGAYDDRNFWDNVVPGFKCDKCGKSSNDLGVKPAGIPTKYDEYEVI